MSVAVNQESMACEFRPFFQALAQGHIAFPRCSACQRFHWYPLQSCPHCGERKIHWSKISGAGTLYSWTTIHHAFGADPPPVLPYVVGLVVFEDAPGVRLITNIVGVSAEQLIEQMPLTPLIHLDPKPILHFKPLAAKVASGN
jgi:uncharacterized protein